MRPIKKAGANTRVRALALTASSGDIATVTLTVAASETPANKRVCASLAPVAGAFSYANPRYDRSFWHDLTMRNARGRGL
jgi:hypothetical protein